MAVDTDDDLTEMADMNVTRVDAVKGAANGATFLLVKALEDPAAQADMADAVVKAEQSTKTQNDLPDSAFAFIEDGGEKDADGKTTPRSLRHFPVNDAAHVRNALARATQSPFGDKAMPKIRAAAKKFGIDTGDMAKADGDPDGTPGDAAWETRDSALLHNAAAMLAQANTMLGHAQDREQAELEAGVEDGYGDICDLDQAMCCLDQALGIVARLVYTEAAEATAAGNGDGTAVVKAGRRLSAKTVAALNDVIAKANALLAGDQKSSTPNNKSEGAAGTDKEDDMNDAELAKALDDRDAKLTETITSQVTTAVADMIKGLQPQAAEPTTPVVDTPAASDPNEALVKGLADAVKEAMSPVVTSFEDRLAKMEATPRRGVGPLAQPPRGGAAGSDLAEEVKSLLAKAAAETDPDRAQRHKERASMLALTVGQTTGRLYDNRVPYDLPSTD